MDAKMKRLNYTIEQAEQESNLSRTFIYKAIQEGKLKSFKVGRRRLIEPASLEALLDQLKAAA